MTDPYNVPPDQLGPTPEEYRDLWDVDPGRLQELMKRGENHGRDLDYVPPGQRGPTPWERKTLWDTNPVRLLELEKRGQKI